MALSVTQLYHTPARTGFGGASGFTSGSFTPANNSFLIVVLNTANDNSVGTNTVAGVGLSGGSLSWTKQTAISAFNSFSLSFQSGIVVFTAPVTTGASMTVTSTGYITNSNNEYYIDVYNVTGYNTSTPIGATALNNNNTSNSPTLTLSGAPASSSVVMSLTNSGVGSGSPTVTAGTGFSVLDQYTDSNYFVIGSETRTGSTSTSVPWTDVSVGDTIPGNNSLQNAFELIAAASGPVTPTDCSFLFQPNIPARRVPSINIQERRGLAPQDSATPSALAFWSQPPFLGPTPKSTQNTNQAFSISPQEPKTPTNALTSRTHVLLRHVPTIYTAQSFLCNPTIGPPVPVDAFWVQPPDLLNHPHSLDTNQPVASFQAPTVPVPSNQVNEYWSFAPIGHLAIGQGTLPTSSNPTPADCSFLFQPSALLNHPQTLDTNQPKENFFSGWANATPTQFGFWTQAPNLLWHAVTLDTNQSVDQGWTQGLTPASLAFWRQSEDLLRHPSTLDTNQSFNADFAGRLGAAPSQLGFWTQAPDLLRHALTLDTNQPFNAEFSGVPGVAPTQFGFWTQAPDLLRHPNTVDTRQQFEFAPPTPGVTPADCAFLFQPSALLNHVPTLDTNQPLDDTFFGWASDSVTPTSFGFFTQTPDLLRHPATLDTRQQFEFNPPPPTATSSDCSFLFQPAALLNHAPTLDTNQALDDTFAGWNKSITPSALGFWLQAPDLFKHPYTVDTNQSRISYQDKATPASLGFWTQAPNLLRHPNTVDTNQPFVFNPPIPGATPSALWWFQPPDLLRHPTHLDTNQPRLVSQVGVTPASLAFWRQPEDLFKHPATLNTQQSFKYLPPPQPPFGWLIQAQDLLRHPVPFILGMQPFAELPPIIHVNRLIKVYFFD